MPVHLPGKSTVKHILLVSKIEFQALQQLNKSRSMAESTSGEVDPPENKSSRDPTNQGLQGVEHKNLGRLSYNIIPHILSLYGCSATARDFEIYAPNATFEDPLMCAYGVKQIKSSFYSLPKVFSEAKIVEYDVQEHETSPSCGEILIDSKQHYKIMGKNIDIISLIKLQVEHGRVVRHEDWWDKKPLRNRHTVKVPLIGRMAETVRRCSMLVTHAVMGFGKDPRP